MPKKKNQRKKTKKQKKKHQHVQPADPVTRGGLPPGLVLPKLDVEALGRPVAQMMDALAKALANRPLELTGLSARAGQKDETAAAEKTRRSES